MSTLIEILDYEQTENIISPLIFDFDRIIYLYDKNHNVEVKRKSLKELLNTKGHFDVQFVQVDHPESLFEQLVSTYPDAIFHLSNGSRTLLVQMAQFCERTSQKCYSLNFQRKTFINIHGCEDLKSQFKVPHLSIQDVIALSAGEIIKTSHALPKMDESLLRLMKQVIELMNRHSVAWTRLLGTFANQMKDAEEASFWMDVPKEKGQNQLLNELEKLNVLESYVHKDRVRVSFENRTMMKLFSDSGAWLEYQSYLECAESGLFDDVRISTVIDWNKESLNRNDPTCEVDLIVVKNCIPVFVSCKMNKCTALDLYEIKLLSQKLGGSLGKAAVISKAPSLKDNEPLCLKAKELDVLLIREEEIRNHQIAQMLYEVI